MCSSFFCPSNNHSVGRYFFQYCRKNSRSFGQMDTILPPCHHYPYRHPFAVDIGQLQRAVSLARNPEEYVIIRITLVLEVLRDGKKRFHLRDIQNNRKLSLAPGCLIFSRPVAFQRRSVEKFKAGTIEPECPLGRCRLLIR